MWIFMGVPQMTVGLSMTANFGKFGGYFFGNFRDKASNIISRYATHCRSVNDSKMNDLEWLFCLRKFRKYCRHCCTL